MTGKKHPRKKSKKSPQEGGSIASVLGTVAKGLLPLISQIFQGDGRSRPRPSRSKK